MKKLALTAASVVLVLGGASACGGGDSGDGGGKASDGGGDSGTSTTEFCGAFEDFSSALAGVDPQADPADLIKKLKDEAKKLGDVGTPDDIPDDAKAGFETVLNAIDDLPDDATLEDLSNLEQEFSDDDKANAEAFDTYLTKTCPDLGEPDPSVSSDGVSPSESPAPSESESESSN